MRKRVLLPAVVVIVAIAGLWLSQDRHVQNRVQWAIHHIRGPWNPFAKRITNCAPYAAVRWRDSVPEVQVDGTWYELVAVDDVPTDEIVGLLKKDYGRGWRKRFEENLSIVLQDMGMQGHCDSDTGPLTVCRLDSGETLTLNAKWTSANWHAILTTAIAAWKANGRKDPRDDATLP
jgi:hypothetical protein